MLQNLDNGAFLVIENNTLIGNTMQVTVLQSNENYSSSISDSSASASILSYKNTENNGNKKSIYVCTFCQVFSSLCAEVSEHIATVHSELLPADTRSENFVSKLHSLQGNAVQKNQRVGRPRKSEIKSPSTVESKRPIVEPVPGPDGLFWCKKCLRHFRKSRQLTQHICLDEDQDVSSSESSFESVEDPEFKKHSIIERAPWTRAKKPKRLKGNPTDTSNTANEKAGAIVKETEELLKKTIVPHWRNDPSYIPLFQNENEKSAFEQHLKSIDYSYVDDLYQKTEKKCRNHKSTCGYVQSVLYSCNFCNKVLTSLSHIRLHCLTHTDFKPFTCPKCPYRANAKGSLYMHMRKHTGNLFTCNFCDFKCIKRSHLADHEATHSSVFHLCKLCKNPYKTQRSLISHIRKYHNNPGGKKYIKYLTSKQPTEFKCNICKKKFKSAEILNTHNQVCHEIDFTQNVEQNNSNNNILEDSVSKIPETAEIDYAVNSSENMQHSKDPLAEIVLNDFLQQNPSHGIMYDNNVFQQPNENILPSASNNLLETLQVEAISAESSVLEECQKTLDLDILNECLQTSDLQALQNSTFSNECVQNFNLQPNMSRRHSLQSNPDSNPDVQHLQEISVEKCEGIKPVEIKLFEKCKRAPAYVCCVCSSIYICPATLKAHLKGHVNNTNLIEQPDVEFDSTKVSEAANELENVCEILPDPSEACSFDEELEKLYTSSLDMMWYLPEVSVVLQNDPAVFDRLLDDISNFPVTDNDSSQDLNKDPDDNMLKCFDEL